MRLIQQSKVSTLKLLQPACLCLELLRVLEKSGLGEPFGKASLANTVFRLGRFISMGNWSTGLGGNTVIHLKPGLMKPGRGVCPGPWQREEKTGGGQGLMGY